MEQYNRTTKPHISTLNWYLYKPYTSPHSSKLEENGKEKTNTDNTQKTRKNSESKINTRQKDDFEEVLFEAIDEGLSILGESAKKVVYSYLEKTFKMSPQDIPSRIEEYVSVIEAIFGAGAKIIQIQTMRKLYQKVGYPIKQYPEQKNLTFIEYVETVKTEKKQRDKVNKKEFN